MKELVRSTWNNTRNTKIVDPYTSSMSQTSLQTKEAFTMKEYKHTHRNIKSPKKANQIIFYGYKSLFLYLSGILDISLYNFLGSTHFFISSTFISNVRLKLAKINQNLSDTLRLNFCYLKMIFFLNPHYHPKIIGDIQGRLFKWGYTINNNGNKDENEKYIT